MTDLPLVALEQAADALRTALAAIEQSRKAMMLAGSNVRPAPMLDLSRTTMVPVLGKLVDQPRPRSNGRKQAEIDSELWAVFKSDFLRPQQPGIGSCYERVSVLAAERGLSIPSAETFRRRLIAEGLHAAMPRRVSRTTTFAPLSKTDSAPRTEEVQPEARESSRTGPADGRKKQPAQAGGEPVLKPMPVEPVRPVESVPVEPDQLDRADAPLPEEPERDDIVSRKPVQVASSSFAEPRRKADAVYYGRVTRDARELEAPVDRLDVIRRAAEKLKAGGSAPARASLGERRTSAPAIPVNPAERRLAQIAAAIRFLHAKGVLVTVNNREALIRTYRIAGRSEVKLAEDVIALAIEKGAQL